MRIAHIADIHVKDRRRDEYAAVFRALAGQLAAEAPPPDVVAVAGDVFDTMSKASANNWEDVAGLLSMLADVAPVVIIPGNHDLNVRAAGAPDLIGPMLVAAGGARALQPPRVTYWRDSGVYTHPVAGRPAVWAAGIPGQPGPDPAAVAAALAAAGPGAPLIGLYHESVGGARYPNGVLAEDTPLSRGDLAALAAAAGPGRPCAILLGDIHLRQEVPFAGSGPGAAAWYPGSLVCLTFGEAHVGHGYLLWDLDGAAGTVRVTPRDVPNDRAFLTIRLGPAGQDLTAEPRPARPQAYRVAYSPGAPAAAVAAAVDAAAARYGYGARSVEAHRDPAAAAPGAEDAAGPAASQALAAAHRAGCDWAHHAALVREILAAEPAAVAAAALARYEAAVARTLGQAAAPRAELARLEFDNMYCYGPGNVVDFDALRAGRPGLVGFIAPNQAGKSSLFDVLIFALSDEVPRGTKHDLVRLGAGGYRVRLRFRVDGREGRVEKSGGRGDLVRGDHAIRLWCGGEELTADTLPETAARARDLLGRRACLDAVTFLRPAEVAGCVPFTLAAPAERRKTLSALLDLGSFDALAKDGDKEISEARAVRRALLRQYAGADSWKEGLVEGRLGELAALLAGEAAKCLAAAEAAGAADAAAAGDAAAARAAAGDAAVARAAAAAVSVAAAARASDACALAAETEAAAEGGLTAREATEALGVAEAQAAAAAAAATEARAAETTARAYVEAGLADPNGAAAAEALAAAAVAALGAPNAWPAQPSAGTAALAATAPPAVPDTAAAVAALAAARVEPPGLIAAKASLAEATAADAAVKARLAGLTAAYTRAVAAPPPEWMALPPVDGGPGGGELVGVLKELMAAATQADEHAALLRQIAPLWAPGCAGCDATRVALGGTAVAAEALVARAATLAPNVFAGLAASARASADLAAARAAEVAAGLQAVATAAAEAEAALAASLAGDAAVRTHAAAVRAVEAWGRHEAARAAAETCRQAAACAQAAAAGRASVLVCARAALALALNAETAAAGALRAAAATAGNAAADEVRRADAQAQTAPRQAAAAAAVQAAADAAEAAAAANTAALETAATQARCEAAAATARDVLAAAKAAAAEARGAAERHESAAGACVAADRDVAVCAAYRKILHPKDGIGARLLTAATAGIAAEVEAALKAMDATFTIDLSPQYDLALVDRRSGVRVPAALGSGYQQFVSAIAVRWALARVARVPLPSCFMIDEGFGCLDDGNLPRVAEALSALALYAPAGCAPPTVIAVTHREDMAPYFAERLGIQVGDRQSRIQYPAGAAADLAGIADHSLKLAPPVCCADCGVEIVATAWANHLASAGHQRKAQQAVAAARVPCGPCGRDIRAAQWEAHCMTACHIKAVGRAARREAPAAAPEDAAPADAAPDGGDAPAALSAAAALSATCGPCGREVPTATWAAHLATRGHLAAAEALAAWEAAVQGPAAAAAGALKLVCTVCPAGPVYSAKQWARHVGTAAHLRRAGN